MQPFTTLDAPAVPLDMANVDTDQIIPARFLRQPRSVGYDNFLFHDLRAGKQGGQEAFVLDRPGYAGARILVAERNFGCGSSREAAVYALADAGLRVVVAPSFGDIFASNAANNGLLTVVLPAEEAAGLRRRLSARPGTRLTVDLEAQTVHEADRVHRFDIDPFRKECLLLGLDHIDLTLRYQEIMDAFGARYEREPPWATPARIG